MDIQQTFATNLRKYRKAARLSQEKLAELSGLHRTYIGGIEQRRINASLKNIGKIAQSLNVDPAVLFLEDGQRRTERPAPDDVAVVMWTGDEVIFRPVEAAHRDLTVHVLSDLVERGYTGGELAHRYNLVIDEINRFLDGTDAP